MTVRSRSNATYELLRPLAEGGMAELFLARAQDTGDNSVVVLKRIRPAFTSDERFVAMFLDEARLASRLSHPGIARVIDVGRTGDTYFYTMEYVRGVDARELLIHAARAHRRIPVPVAVALVIGAARALHGAHEQRDIRGKPLQIVHRDVSPSNLMVSFAGQVKVVDFGVAKAADRMAETRSGAIKGKIAYLSPEQCRGLPLDRRSDVFSLGIVAWELLTQRRLFRRPSDYATMHAITTEAVAAPSTRNAEVPAAVDQAILSALALDPGRRTRTTHELADQLTEIAHELGWDIGPGPTAALIRELFGEPEAEAELGPVAPVDITAEIDLNEALLRDDDAAAFGEVTVRRRAPVLPRPSSATPPPVPIPEPRSAAGELTARAAAPILLHGELANVVISDELIVRGDADHDAPPDSPRASAIAVRADEPPAQPWWPRRALASMAAGLLVGGLVGVLGYRLRSTSDQVSVAPTMSAAPPTTRATTPPPAPPVTTSIAFEPVLIERHAARPRPTARTSAPATPVRQTPPTTVPEPVSLSTRYRAVRDAYRRFTAQHGMIFEAEWQAVLFATTTANQSGALADRDRALAALDALDQLIRSHPTPPP